MSGKFEPFLPCLFRLLVFVECNVLHCQAAGEFEDTCDNDVQPLVEGTPSVFNIVIDCCNQTRVNVQWVRVRSEAGINWLYLDYHCSSSNETFEVLYRGRVNPGSVDSKLIIGNWTSDATRCAVRGCYEQDSENYPVIRIADISCNKSAARCNINTAGTVDAAQLYSTKTISVQGPVDAAQLYSTKTISVQGTADALELYSASTISVQAMTVAILVTVATLAVCLIITLVGVAAKRYKDRRGLAELLNSHDDNNDLEIDIDLTTEVADVCSVNSNDISYSELDAVDAEAVNDRSEDGSTLMDYVGEDD